MADFAVQDGQSILFIGDSITDAGRRAAAAPYGQGYVAIFIDLITARYPERNIACINKGNGGDRVTGLFDRWRDDVIRHQPDWLAIMIGINALHSVLRGVEPNVPLELFREKYDGILARTRDEIGAQVVLIDPFYVSVDGDGDGFRAMVLETIPKYIAVVEEMAEKYHTRRVPMHDIFAEQLKHRESEVFCPEPVHPNRTGHVVIANALLDALTD